MKQDWTATYARRGSEEEQAAFEAEVAASAKKISADPSSVEAEKFMNIFNSAFERNVHLANPAGTDGLTASELSVNTDVALSTEDSTNNGEEHGSESRVDALLEKASELMEQ